jgi:hypothetical protein
LFFQLFCFYTFSLMCLMYFNNLYICWHSCRALGTTALSVCPSVCLSVCLSGWVAGWLSVHLSDISTENGWIGLQGNLLLVSAIDSLEFCSKFYKNNSFYKDLHMLLQLYTYFLICF